MNLDGETNLKIRKAMERTWEYVTAEAAAEFKNASIECELPNNSLYTFVGNLMVGKQVLPLSPNQILLRVRFLADPLVCIVALLCLSYAWGLKEGAMAPLSSQNHMEYFRAF